MRIDKWLWAVNITKNRTHATNYCKQGKVYLDGTLAKPSKIIKVEQHITIKTRTVKVVKVLKFAQKPVRKDSAMDFYEIISEEMHVSENKYKNLDPDYLKNNNPEEALNKFKDFKYKQQKDGMVSKKDKRARQNLKNWEY